MVSQIVPGGGILRFQFAGFLPMLHGALLILGIVQETAVGEVSAGVVRVPPQKTFVRLTDGFEPLLDARAERGAGQTCTLFAEGCVASNPLVHFLLCGVVQFQKFLIFFFDRVVRVGDLYRNTRRSRDEIADRRGLVGGDERAQQSDQKNIHELSLAEPEKEATMLKRVR